MAAYTVRPLVDRSWLRPPSARRNSQFTAEWSSTEEELLKEIELLGGKNVVIEIDITEDELRINGTIRANARPGTPAVRVSFDTKKHGSLMYRCDRYAFGGSSESWKHNVRAIVLTLQALRAVDRYGATETGQQYTGFKALPAGSGKVASNMTSDEAYKVLSKFSGVTITQGESDQSVRARVREARIATHPDRNDGDQAGWDLVEQAASALGVK